MGNRSLTGKIKIPKPPKFLFELDAAGFIPAPDVKEFVEAAFLDPGSKLFNEDHGHLHQAEIGYLWTTEENSRHQNTIIGTAEIPKPISGNKWQKARYEQQIREWFGDDKLDFLITLYAPWFLEAEDVNVCASIDHELYHCGMALDAFDQPKFGKDGNPVFALKGHDVEEHLGVVERWGAAASGSRTARLVELALAGPKIALADITAMCGNCAR